jgi:predicted DNA-binding ribbon-helix-helix protein
VLLTMPGLVKRSLMIDGHRTSVALEPEFWAALEDAARADGATLAHLIAAIDAARATAAPNRLLASACRVYALERAGRR